MNNPHQVVPLLEIVIQNVATFRIDPAVLRRPDSVLALVVSEGNHLRLVDRHREDAFDDIVVLPEFTVSSLVDAVAGLMDRHGYPAGQVRLLCHDEYSLRLAAETREKLDLAGDRVTEVAPFTNKLAMKAALGPAGIRMPRYAPWEHDRYRAGGDAYLAGLIRHVGLPAFVKPLSESGSVGARKITTWEELRTWAAGRDGRADYEIDEFIDGTLYHVDSIVADGKIIQARVYRDARPLHEYAEGHPIASWTLPEDNPDCAPLAAFNQRVLSAMDKPRSSVFHHEIFKSRRGELIFLEIAARPPAALIPATGRIRWGSDIEQAHFALQRGERVLPSPACGPYAAYAYFPKHHGQVAGRVIPALRSAYRWTWNAGIGDTLRDATDVRDFAASVLLWNPDYDSLCADLARLDRCRPLVTR
jgi:biotin carboxylase